MENKEFYIPCDGIRLHAKLDFPAVEKEKFPLVIIIHGFTGHMEEPHIVAVSETCNEIGFATLRVEMFGHGKSDGEFKDHTLFKWLTNALTVMDYAKHLDFVSGLYLCGHSQGGLLTMLVGAMERDSLKAILPLSPAWMIPENARGGELLGIPFDPVQIPDELSRPDGLTLNGNYIRAAQTIFVEPSIERYDGPVLLVHGDKDEAVPVFYAYKAAELYQNARLVIVSGDTHCYDYHLDQVTSAIKEFLLSCMHS